MDRITTLKLALLFISVHGANGQFPCLPEHIVTSAMPSTELLVKWSCQDGGQASQSELEYQVEYQLTNLGQCDTGDGSQTSPFDILNTAKTRLVGSTTDDAGMTLQAGNFRYSLTLSGLLPYSTYRIKISSYSTQFPTTNPTESTAQYQMTSEAAPTITPSGVSVITEARGLCSLGFKWNDLPCGSRRGDIKYVIELNNLSTAEADVGNPETAGNNYLTTSLGCLSEYQFRVHARNNAGDGPWTDPLKLSTFSDLKVSATSDQSTQLLISWTIGNKGCTCNVMYVIEYTLTDVGQCGSIQNDARMTGGTTSVTSYTISNLSPYSTYVVYVTPMVDDRQEPAKTVRITTLESAPTVEPQVNVDKNLITTSSIYVSWNKIPCESKGSTIIGYGFQLFDESNVKVADDTTYPYDPDTLSVTISGLQPDNTYTLSVYATNIIGPGSSTDIDIRTLPAGPDPPTSVRLQDAEKTSLQFAWDAASCGSFTQCSSIENYVYKLSESGNKEVIPGQETTETSVTITKLAPCTMYEFSVAATSNTRITGPQSSPVTATTTVDVPLPILSIDTVVNIDDPSMLMVTWQAPDGPCQSNSYSVTYKLDNRGMCGDGTTQSLTIPEVSGTSVIIDNLTPYSSYSIFITPKNGAGSGMDTIGSATTPESVPSAPPSDIRKTATTANSVTFMWNEVSCANRNGIITKYHYKLVDVSENIQRNGSVTTKSVTVVDLQPCSNYIFSVAAITAVGRGQYSAGVPFRTNEVVPRQIKAVKSVENPSNIIVTWQEPDGPCQAKSYTAKYSLDNQGMCGYVTSQNITLSVGTGTQVEITNIYPYSTYSIYITAKNGAGSGMEKKEIVTTEEVEPTVSPSMLQRTDTTAYSVTFTWTELTCENQNGVISGYHYQLVGESANSPSEDTVTTTTVTIRDLQPCSNYTFSVAAATSAGRGPYSGKVSFVTDEVAPAPVSEITAEPQDQREGENVSLLVNWRSPSAELGECAAVSYLVQYELVNGDMCNADTQTSTVINKTEIDTRITLTDLIPYSSYQIYVRAKNEAGLGMKMTIRKNTGEKKPTGAPIDVNVDQSSSTSISFTWQNPACGDRNGLITMYSCSLTNGTDINMETTHDFNIEYDGLVPYTEYSFTVKARTSAGFGPFSRPLVITTDEDIPPAPRNARKENADTTSITFAWSPPDPPHGEIIGYVVEYNKTDESTMNVSVNDTSYTFGELRANNEVSIRVQAETKIGLGPWSNLATGLAAEGEPGPPGQLIALAKTETDIEIQWGKPKNPNGIILDYAVDYKAIEKGYDLSFAPDNMYMNGIVKPPLNENKYNYSAKGLEPSTKYKFQISGRTLVGSGDKATIEVFTKPPKSIQTPNVIEIDRSGTFSFGQLSKYASNVYVAVAESDKVVRRKRQSILTSDPESYIVANLTRQHIEDNKSFTLGDNKTYNGYFNEALQTGESYDVKVAHASCNPEAAECTKAWSSATTFTAQNPPLKGPNTGSTDSPVAVVAVLTIIAILMFVIIAVLIIKRDKVRAFRNRVSKTESKDEGVHDNPVFDPDLEKKDVAEDVKAEPEKHDNGAPPQPSPMLPVTPSRRRKQLQSQKQPGTPVPTRKIRRDNVIPVEKIKEYIHEQTSGDRNGFVAEFKEIPGDSQIHEWNDAELAENYKNKNRFINIMPYDHSRVKLEIGGEDPVLNFINASLIKVYDDKCFIATHGPLPDIFEDTWQLVWEQNVTKIIMVTNLVEKKMIKCHKYWPDVVTTYGQFEVRPLTVEKYANYTIRGFRLSMVDEEKAMEIKQFHFTSWPDFGVPTYPTPLLNFMKVVNAFDPQDSGPPIIHCSAGVGRTGTYITIDSMMKMAKDTGNINVPDFVAQIRDFRINMVQTSHQYQFIYEALYEALLLDNTSILVTNLREEHMKLSAKIKKGEDKGKTGFELELKILNELTYRPVVDQGAGADPSNTDKNRFPDKIPDEKDRPSLATPGDEDSTDYINAAYLDSRRLKDIFLATQMTMPNTQGDIWRMVYDHYSYVIVMLNDMDNKDPTIAKYWPEEASVISVGSLQIEFQSTQKLDDKIIGRTFKITNTQFPDQDSRIVLQLQYTDWPADKDVPNSAKTFLALASLVQNHHDQNDNVGPITVHCMNGLGRSGVFCALLSVIDKMKSDKMVDVFQEVKRLRMSRSGMVENVKQYKFLYDVALVYLDQYGSYENFSPTGSLMHGQKPPSANGVFGESSETESTEGDNVSNQ